MDKGKSDPAGDIVVRLATVEDRPDIVELVSAVMGEEDAELVTNIWASPWHLPDFELVAAQGKRVVGHILYGLGVLNGAEVPALAPLCVATGGAAVAHRRPRR